MADNPFYKALDVLKERGWIQRKLFDHETGAVCSLGALGVVESRGWVPLMAGPVYENAAVLQAVLGGTWVSDFNDHPSTSFEDVVLAFKHAAVKWEEDQ